MGEKLEVVLTWAERIAKAVSIVVPAVREISEVFTEDQSEAILICDDEN